MTKKRCKCKCSKKIKYKDRMSSKELWDLQMKQVEESEKKYNECVNKCREEWEN